MMKRKAYWVVLTLVLLLAAGSGASVVAAPAEGLPAPNYDVYLKLNGVCGESKAEKFANWIELTGVQFGVTNSKATSANGGGSGAGKAVLGNIVVTKNYDCSSIALFTNLISGKHLKDGQIVFVKPGADRPVPILKLDLTDVSIADIQFDDMTESVSLRAGSIAFSYYAQDSRGGMKPPIQGGWDFVKNIAR